MITRGSSAISGDPRFASANKSSPKQGHASHDSSITRHLQRWLQQGAHRPHRIQIDIRRHRPRRDPTFYDHALEPIFPQRPRPRMLAIEPFRESLQQGFHKPTQIVHPSGVASPNLRHAASRLQPRTGKLLLPGQRQPRLIHRRQLEFPAFPLRHRPHIRHLLGNFRHLRLTVKNSQPLEQHFVRNPSFRNRCNLQQEMESLSAEALCEGWMIRHQAVRKHPASRKLLTHPHQHPEMLSLHISKQKTSPHHPPAGVIHLRLRSRILPCGDPTPAVISAHHPTILPTQTHIARKFSTKSMAFFTLL